MVKLEGLEHINQMRQINIVPNMSLEAWRTEVLRLMTLAGCSGEELYNNMEKLEPYYYKGHYPHELIRTNTPPSRN